MIFKDIIGQKEVKERLLLQVKENRVPHAMLLSGSPGSGKLALAIAYAQYLMCTNKQESDSCGECPSCKKISKLIHPDLHFIYPGKAGKEKSGSSDGSEVNPDIISIWRNKVLENPYFSENDWYEAIDLNNKQGIINVASASEVIRKLSLKSYESDIKVMIIWLAERMNVQAANKLLKLIEEPPAGTYFILITEHPNQILKTILSRTQQIHVPPITRSDIAVYLTDKYGIEPGKANDVSRASNGNFNEALKLLNQNSGEYFELYRNMMRLCYANRYIEMLDWVDEVSRLGREEQKDFLQYSLKLTRESLMLNLGLDKITYLIGEEEEFGKKFSPFLSTKNVNQVTKTLNHAFECISQNGNPQITFSSMVLKLSKFINPTK
ncbi:MAG: polymerase subunit delta [Tenuifilum sp.]|jgi:DNA polymerase-3 subunit delta'|uniref:DNA polymerase III subunit delta n=1 Tax=Tenuifilum thalassicum TaxID=2590900 RepID=A0A7D3XTG8_9BACT|nr:MULTISPECIES: DNA polymerase III subunit delta' [Tenuifilum]MDI3525883.1 polymerase subunit delta [Tenuifilum sp.]QKG78871.1 DNA polymerase III subunit delta' [Tenuifilum thalassicum]